MNDRQNMGFDEFISDAERKLRSGVDALGRWSDEARDLIHRRPGVVTASLAVTGFFTGVLIRNLSKSPRSERALLRGALNPWAVLLTGALTGLILGPQVASSSSSEESEIGLRSVPTPGVGPETRH